MIYVISKNKHMSENSPNINELRAFAASQGMIDVTTIDGTTLTCDEAEAYFRGRAAADKAVELLKHDGVLPPELTGMYEYDDRHFRTALQDIAASLGISNPNVVYNPGCGTHATLATAFPEARAIFIDKDKEAMHWMHRGGFEAYTADMHEYKLPDGLTADIVLILNAGHMTEDELREVLSEKGIVIVNDWHGAASYMRTECPGFELQENIKSAQNVHGSEGNLRDTNTLFVFAQKSND